MKKPRLFVENDLVKKILILMGIFFIFLAKQSLATGGPIIINEVMYDLKGADSGYEWIEIKNISNEPVDLTGWRFNDGENHILNAPPKNGGQGSLIIPPAGFAILADKADLFLSTHPNFSGTVIDTAMSLNNTESTLKIFDKDGNVVDEVYYNKEMGGNGNGFSLERVSDSFAKFCESKEEGGSPGRENNFDCNKVSNTSTPTPIPIPTPTQTITPTFSPMPTNTPDNLFTNSETPTLTPEATPIRVNLIINEFLPNPSGADNEGEWIELYNNSEVDVNLNGWRLEDASGAKYVFKDEVIKKNDFLVLPYSKTKISLNNNGETLILYAPQNQIAFKITYSGTAKEDCSFARFAANDWRWTSILTPGNPNQFSSNINTNNNSKISVDSQIENIQNIEENTNDSKPTSTPIPLTASNADNLLTPRTEKIIIIVIGVGVVLSVASALFIKKFLP